MPPKAPLTFQQLWLWTLLLRYEDWKCVCSYGLRLKGTLDVQLLQRGLNEILQRHSSLRTRITLVDGVPMQHNEDHEPHLLDITPIAGTSPKEIEINARRAFDELAESRMDSLNCPLARIQLLKLNEQEHWLLFAVHRFASDCFSMDHVLPELCSLYGGYLEGRSVSSPTRPMEYRDYALRQHETHAEWCKRHEPYWRKRLDTAKSLQWPIDACAADTPRGTLGRMNTRFERALSTQLADIARGERTLLATVVLAVYVATLWRWCKQNDFVVPFFVAGRQSEHKYVVGYFTHILYLRVELTGNETLADLSRLVGNEFFRALTHQDFGAISTQLPQFLEGTFFQWLTWHPEESSSIPVAQSLTAERVSVVDFAENMTAIPPGLVDVEITFYDTPQGIYASGVYRADLFTTDTMQRFMEALRETADQLAKDPRVPMATLFQQEAATPARSTALA